MLESLNEKIETLERKFSKDPQNSKTVVGIAGSDFTTDDESPESLNLSNLRIDTDRTNSDLCQSDLTDLDWARPKVEPELSIPETHIPETSTSGYHDSGGILDHDESDQDDHNDEYQDKYFYRKNNYNKKPPSPTYDEDLSPGKKLFLRLKSGKR